MEQNMMSPETQGYPNQVQYDKGGNYYYPSENDLRYCVRRGFIIKTYGILLTQLGITCAFIALSLFENIRKFIQDTMKGTTLIIFLVVFIVITIAILVIFVVSRERARRVPLNYILLFTFTLCMSFYCLLLCSYFSPRVVITAAVLTFGATVGLTVYACKTKDDFTFCGAFLFCFIFIGVISVGFFFWVPVFYYVFIVIGGVILYSLYIIYDTQLIIGNKTFEYSIDDYCLAALNLYIDIIYLFIRLLQLVALLTGNK